MFDRPATVMLAGASGGLARAIGSELVRCFPRVSLLTLSRGEVEPLARHDGRHRHLRVALGESSSIRDVETFLSEVGNLPDWVINCCGLLHDGEHGPEKSLDQCRDDWLLESMRVNVLTHLHLAQALGKLLQRRQPLLWASLSAKVGSIGDNHLGGWYSYRISKAALNMLVRNLAIEWGRRLESSCVVAIHPGTTDTALSKPFQENIPAGKLYHAELSAARIVEVLRRLSPPDSGQLLFWDGTPLPW
ncbi:SDR family oxidoreductase [Microbulbifer magnicolonia]|uniref:SDR family oxidoreductase n=1 Tax=Microbulbifer magnicolonia TaxID=3109744 RepID=UPI002B403450|nr:SDR family oxidoreductase [Microbulbifer sp. GG15]